MAKKVYISAGHGGSDPGAVANGFKEKDLNLTIALACRDELKRHGVNVKMSREKDMTKTMSVYVKECNSFKPDLALDIHNNAGGGDGAEVFHTHKGGIGKTLANNILAEVKAIGQNSRGAKTRVDGGVDYYGFIRETTVPAVIVECAFVDNKNDVKIIDTAAEQKAMGVAIAKGVLKTLGIAWKAAAATTKPAATTTKKKTVDELAKEVIAGKWGNGTTRKNKLTAAGYDYAAVQAKVDELMGGSKKTTTTTTAKKKSLQTIANEVIAGLWGNGTTRKKKLAAAGYTSAEISKIQELVNAYYA